MICAADVVGWCRSLAEHSEERGFTTRTFLSPPMRLVHRDLASWMERLGMDVQVDAAGNLRGRSGGAAAGGPRLFIGSHLDTVPRAGAFDGVLGVVIGIALLEGLQADRLPVPVEVVGFSDEEGVRFGVPFLGSRAFVGALDAELLGRRDAAGISVSDAIQAFGLDPAAIPAAAVTGSAAGYLEIHVEQGPVLDNLNLPLGVVESIAGQTRAAVTFSGCAGHAGTTPMAHRRDALAGAAEWIAGVEREACATRGLVATVGRVDAAPGASNVIAGTCTATLDVRHTDDRTRVGTVRRLAELAEEIGMRRRLDVTWRVRLDQPAVRMDPSLTAALERGVRRAGATVHRLPSGAGHDAMVVAGRMPAAMLFIRSPGGISHQPGESVLESDVALALEAGRHFLREVAGGLP